MFIFRWIKKLVIFALICVGLYIGSAYVDYHGRPVKQHVDEFFASDLWKEGKRDLLTWAAAILHFAGDKVEEGITDDDKKKLNELINDDIDLGKIADKVSKAMEAPPKAAPSEGNAIDVDRLIDAVPTEDLKQQLKALKESTGQ